MSESKSSSSARDVHALSMVGAIQNYAQRILAIPGMKVLVLDEDTTPLVSMVISQTDIITKDVFLVQRLDKLVASLGDAPKSSDSTSHMKGVLFVRPTRTTLSNLRTLLGRPVFKEMHLFFSNFVSQDALKSLAAVDKFDAVRVVQEFYGDYLAVDRNMFHADLPMTSSLWRPSEEWRTPDAALLSRNKHCIISMLLSLKKRPVVRVSGQSPLCRRLGNQVAEIMRQKKDLFHFQKVTRETPVLLILDRRDDPVTPLLTQWTYRAMIHELLGMHHNRVDLSQLPGGVSDDLKEVVLACHQDKFFAKHRNLNFGELGAAVKEHVAKYQAKRKDTSKLDSLADVRKVLNNFPEFKQMAGNVSKHVTVLTELSRQVGAAKLMDCSEVEQELACRDSHSAVLTRIHELLDTPGVTFLGKVRLVMLYALRYERNRSEVQTMVGILRDRCQRPSQRKWIRCVEAVLSKCGSQKRTGDLFASKGLLSSWKKKLLGGGLKGVANIYTQHKPMVLDLLDKISKGKLPDKLYPFCDGKSSFGGGSGNGDSRAKAKPDLVFVYYLGGTTFEEAQHIDDLNAANSGKGGDEEKRSSSKGTGTGMRVVLGGSTVHNTKSFMQDLLGESAQAPSFSSAGPPAPPPRFGGRQ